MTNLSPKAVYDNLQQLDIVDSSHSATYRHQAFEILTDPDVSLNWKLAVADRLNQANQDLAHLKVEPEESY